MPGQMTRAELAAQALTDPAMRAAVIADLRLTAQGAIRAGDRAANRGLYRLSISNGRIAGQRNRAANAIEDGRPVDARDLRHVEEAIGRVRTRRDAGPRSTWDHRPTSVKIGSEL